jgi:hypothetical protein
MLARTDQHSYTERQLRMMTWIDRGSLAYGLLVIGTLAWQMGAISGRTGQGTPKVAIWLALATWIAGAVMSLRLGRRVAHLRRLQRSSWRLPLAALVSVAALYLALRAGAWIIHAL